MGKRKEPVIKQQPNPRKQPKLPDELKGWKEYPIWSFRLFDPDIELERGKKCENSFKEIAKHLKSYEGRPWNEIIANDHRDHFVSVNQLTDFAIDRLCELGLEEHQQLIRLRFNNRNRLWGIKEGRIFLALWWDPEHEICPSKKKHT